MIKFLDNKLFRYLSVFLFLNSSILPVKSSSALAAWAINTNGVLELRTKSNTNLIKFQVFLPEERVSKNHIEFK